jgi:hypothetical protein
MGRSKLLGNRTMARATVDRMKLEGATVEAGQSNGLGLAQCKLNQVTVSATTGRGEADLDPSQDSSRSGAAAWTAPKFASMGFAACSC